MDGSTTIFVVGFVSDGGTGGFEWDTDRARIDGYRDWLLAGADSDVSSVRECQIEQLSLDGNYTTEAVTDALNAWPDFWEPAYGEGRRDEAPAPAQA